MFQEVYESSAHLFTLSFVGLFALSLALLAALYLRDSNEDTNLVRAYLNSRLRRARLGRVLAERGADYRHYAAQLSVPALRQQLAHCVACEHAERCVRALADAHAADAELSFCPNLAALQAFESSRSTVRM